jgi:hypothetical protein
MLCCDIDLWDVIGNPIIAALAAFVVCGFLSGQELDSLAGGFVYF